MRKPDIDFAQMIEQAEEAVEALFGLQQHPMDDADALVKGWQWLR